MYVMMMAQLVEMIQVAGCGIQFADSNSGKFGIDINTQRPAILAPLGLEDIETLIETAHEFGHYKQFCRWGNVDLWRNVVRDTPRLIMEHDAWEEAVVILHGLEFTDWEAFITYATGCISSYYQVEYPIYEVIDKMHQFALRMRRKIDDVREVIYA